MFANAEHNRVRIKICGLTNQSDAVAAIECGADALGFNFCRQSQRYIEMEEAEKWLATLPEQICKVAVMVDPSAEEALRAAALPFIDLLQLHGQETPAFCQALAEAGVKFAKAVPVKHSQSAIEMSSFGTDLVVLDSQVDGKFGGTGRPFPWSLARSFVATNPDIKVILAGGLTPENVASAIEQVRPFGVDVTTGVEASKRKKDRKRIRAFVEAARSAHV